MRRKGLVALALTASLALAGTFSSFAGEWQKAEDGYTWRYLEDDGTYATNVDKKKDSFEWYHFDENGYGHEVRNDWIEYEGKSQYINILGIPYADGYLYKNQYGQWITPTDYYVLSSWYTITAYYYVDADGNLLKDKWHRNEDGSWRYFGEDGAMLVNTTTPDGYTVNEKGYWIVNGVVQIQ